LLVVKVGGSLFDLPDMGPRLRRFLASQPGDDRLIVPGGGPTVEAVRDFDRIHGLGEDASHWLALRACTVNAHFLAHLLGNAPVVSSPEMCRGFGVLDPFQFAVSDDEGPESLPRQWNVTSDSVAARAAALSGATLILLKSITLSAESDWFAAAAAGHVDPVFPEIVRAANLSVRVVNLRSWCA
jgi:aspartokinase-like uncharacterized kinase